MPLLMSIPMSRCCQYVAEMNVVNITIGTASVCSGDYFEHFNLDENVARIFKKNFS